MKLSIITPSYNQGQFLEQTIDSVLSQGYAHLEYIIIDGGSTDQSVEIIKKYQKHLAYWVSEPDRGQTHAINKGLSRATGEVFNWINSDDYYEPNTFKRLASHFLDPSVLVVCGIGNIIEADGTFVRKSRGSDVYESLSKTIGWARMDQPETFFRRSVLDEIGLLDERLHFLMDRDIWIKYLLSFGITGIKKVEDVFINFRLHEGSKTVSKPDQFQIDHNSFFYSMASQFGMSKSCETIKQLGPVHTHYEMKIPNQITPSFMEKVLSYYFLKRGDECYYKRDYNGAKKCLAEVRKTLVGKEDQSLLRKLKTRNGSLVRPLIDLIRQIRY